MGIIDRTLERFGFVSRRQFEAQLEEAVKKELDKVPHWLAETADAQRWDIPDPIIYANQADMYRLSPLLGTALDILADDVGLSKFNVLRLVGEEERDIPNHPFELLLRTPNPLDTGLEFLRDSTIAYKLNGNEVWWINKAAPNSPPDEIWPIPFEMITPVPDRQLYISHYEYFPGNGRKPIPIPVDEIVHFKTYNPRSRFVGLSPIESLATTLTGNLGMRKTKAVQYTKYNGSPPSILAAADWVPDETWTEMKREIKNAALKNEMMMLRGTGEGGLTWLARAISNKDAEFIDSLRSDMEDVFNRMAPGLLAMLDKNSTEANALAARATYSEKSWWKTLETFAQKITADILPLYGRKLIGRFEDPRVVDRKLQLQEQEAFERVHTIEEVRKQFYQDDPLGDPRDKLFYAEIKASVSPFGNSQPQGDNQQQQDNQQPAENAPQQNTGGEDVSMKAAMRDLERWRTMALRGKATKAQNFTSDYIPPYLLASIKGQLGAVKNKEGIADLFDTAIANMRPKVQVDPALVLQGIDRALMALERK